MTIGSIGSTYGVSATQALPRNAEAAEVNKGGGDSDGDTDDGGAKVAQLKPGPTVNMSGQKLGQFINVAA